MRIDRRRHVRLEAPTGASAILMAPEEHFIRVGMLKDICEGGLAFTYARRDDLPQKPLLLHLFGPHPSSVCTPALPCRIVCDSFCPVTEWSLPAGLCRAAFDGLSLFEMQMLQEFIEWLGRQTAHLAYPYGESGLSAPKSALKLME